ncbi:MAG TPA: Tex family protein [Anaerolineales bacterium]|nr:Tex family protein [Anaerolineales bacterium]
MSAIVPDYSKPIAKHLQLKPTQVAAAILLFDDGNTIPFIARYRKEKTGGLDEEKLRQIELELAHLRSLDERRETVLNSIREQGKLTTELEQQILAVQNKTDLEDLYAPYKPRRQTRASIARERGLLPLAELILKQPGTGASPEEAARAFISEQVPDTASALAGACDILAEQIADTPQVRRAVREKAFKWGLLCTAIVKDAKDEKRVYEQYYHWEMLIERVQNHMVLAVNRAEKEKVLRVWVDISERDWRQVLERDYRINPKSAWAEYMRQTHTDSAQRLLLPAIERDVRRELTEKAEAHAIQVFAENLRGLLTQPPLADRAILGIDPGFRTGCKVAVINAHGKLLAKATIYPHAPQNDVETATRMLLTLVEKCHVSLISIGNGTACRETEQFVAQAIRQSNQPDLHYLIVNEAGASVYSASPLARAEMPDLDVSMRGAVSIARRAQDPLAELVKIDPKSIGVGLYQHDVDEKELNTALTNVVESVVNRVGVDLNTASPKLLQYVSGIGAKLAENIVAYRDEQGPFISRQALLDVNGLGAKSFQQSAGFMRIRNGSNPLDASAIHPESYRIAEGILQKANIPAETPSSEREPVLKEFLRLHSKEWLATLYGTGVPTITDILEQLVRPGRDPRADLPQPVLRSDVLSMEDLHPGLHLNGTVRNVVDFGAFVDIGVKRDGLLHRRELPRNAHLEVGQVIDVVILQVDIERDRIALGWGQASR